MKPHSLINNETLSLLLKTRRSLGYEQDRLTSCADLEPRPGDTYNQELYEKIENIGEEKEKIIQMISKLTTIDRATILYESDKEILKQHSKENT